MMPRKCISGAVINGIQLNMFGISWLPYSNFAGKDISIGISIYINITTQYSQLLLQKKKQ